MKLRETRDRTVYLKTVKTAPTEPIKSTGLRVLKSMTGNAKLGKGKNTIVKGRYKGLRLYGLTLEERATCPDTCANWLQCFGNNMPFATRHVADAGLFAAIDADLDKLSARHPEGFVVRLHILGDFFSTDYVAHWANWLQTHKGLRLFGYTHREAGTDIGDAIAGMVATAPDRVSILRSDGDAATDTLPVAVTLPVGTTAAQSGTVVCPEQTGKSTSCLDCGLCMNNRTAVSFIVH